MAIFIAVPRLFTPFPNTAGGKEVGMLHIPEVPVSTDAIPDFVCLRFWVWSSFTFSLHSYTAGQTGQRGHSGKMSAHARLFRGLPDFRS